MDTFMGKLRENKTWNVLKEKQTQNEDAAGIILNNVIITRMLCMKYI